MADPPRHEKASFRPARRAKDPADSKVLCSDNKPVAVSVRLVHRARRYMMVVLHLDTVARCLGVSPGTLRRWYARGRRECRRLERLGEDFGEAAAQVLEGERLYHDLYLALEQGLGRAHYRDLRNLRSGYVKNERGLIFRLERSAADLWGTNTQEYRQLRAAYRELQARVQSVVGDHPADPSVPEPGEVAQGLPPDPALPG